MPWAPRGSDGVVAWVGERSELVAVGVDPEDSAIFGPARGKRQLARKASRTARERAEQSVGHAVSRHARVVLRNDDFLLVHRLLADVQKVRNAEHLDLAGTVVGASSHFDDGLGA